MSRPLIPRPTAGESEMNSLPPTAKPKKISTACGACKQRKTKCSGSTPCEACATRGSQCVYDATSDQRRKIAAQRNLHELTEASQNLERHKQLLGGIIAILRTTNDHAANEDLIAVIRSGVDLSQLAAHVRNARRANPAIEAAFSAIDFVIDGQDDLPSPTELLATSSAQNSTSPYVSRRSISNASGTDAQAFAAYLGSEAGPER